MKAQAIVYLIGCAVLFPLACFGKGADKAEKEYTAKVRGISDKIFAKMKQIHATKDKDTVKKINAEIDKLKQAEEAAVHEFQSEMGDAIRDDPDVEKRWEEVNSKVQSQRYDVRVEMADTVDKPHRVIFSEICYAPLNGKSEWIELVNVSNKAVDISGWQIMDGQMVRIALPRKLPLLKPEHFALILLDGTKKAVEVNEKKKQLVIHRQERNILGDIGGQIALLNGDGHRFRPIAANVESYVAWGVSPLRVARVAIRAKRWEGIDVGHVGTDPDRIVPPPPIRFMESGGSFAWVGYLSPKEERDFSLSSWGIFMPSETSPGAPPTRRIPQIEPCPGFKDPQVDLQEDGSAYLKLMEIEDDIRTTDFQVFKTAACKELVLESTDDRITLKERRNYYWRARYTYADGSRSRWSKVYQILSHDTKEK